MNRNKYIVIILLTVVIMCFINLRLTFYFGNKSIERDIETMEKVLINAEGIGKNSDAIITNQRAILDLYERLETK